jgi:hypothetical protein
MHISRTHTNIYHTLYALSHVQHVQCVSNPSFLTFPEEEEEEEEEAAGVLHNINTHALLHKAIYYVCVRARVSLCVCGGGFTTFLALAMASILAFSDGTKSALMSPYFAPDSPPSSRCVLATR